MKEHIETITDSFTDYVGKTHHFVIAALSQNLPRKSSQLIYNPVDDYDTPVTHDVYIRVENFGTTDYLGSVTKVLRLGISICNPVDTFDEHKGILKAVARARNADPALYAEKPGIINTKVVKALLEQEAEYLKNNPENFIAGYADAKARYEKHKEMEAVVNNFSDVEKAVVEKTQNNPKFLDNVLKYLDWSECRK